MLQINITMQKYYQHFPEIDNVYWTNYFLKEFIPKHKFFENTSDTGSSYIQWYKKDFINELQILKLNSLLSSKLQFPPIEYFLIFRHNDMDQLIHADGGKILRNSSFNLPLLGYNGTSMCFYEQKTILPPTIGNANYYKTDNLTLVEKFTSGNEWVLVNSAVPHNVVGIDSNNPRLTVCIRFLGNPTFEDLIKNTKPKQS
jgi:hypothetical protein